MKKTGIIYCITNKKTRKKYVGATMRTLKERMSSHYSTKERVPHISKMLQSTEKSEWVWEILEEGLDREHLRIREEYWIRELNTVDDGYNRSYGSISGARIKKKFSFWHPIHGLFTGYYEECMKKLGCNHKPTIAALNSGARKQYKGWVKPENRHINVWRRARKSVGLSYKIKKGVSIFKVLKNGNPIAIGSFKTLSAFLSCSQQLIRLRVLNPLRKSVKLMDFDFELIEKCGYKDLRKYAKYGDVILL